MFSRNKQKNELTAWGYCREIKRERTLIYPLINVIFLYYNDLGIDSFGNIRLNKKYLSKKQQIIMNTNPMIQKIPMNYCCAFGENKILNTKKNYNKSIKWILKYNTANIDINKFNLSKIKSRYAINYSTLYDLRVNTFMPSIFFGITNNEEFVKYDLQTHFEQIPASYFLGFKLLMMPFKINGSSKTSCEMYLMPYYNICCVHDLKYDAYNDFNYYHLNDIGNGKSKMNANVELGLNNNNNGCIHFELIIKSTQIMDLSAKVYQPKTNKLLLSYCYRINWFSHKFQKFIIDTNETYNHLALSLPPQTQASMQSNFDDDLEYFGEYNNNNNKINNNKINNNKINNNKINNTLIVFK